MRSALAAAYVVLGAALSVCSAQSQVGCRSMPPGGASWKPIAVLLQHSAWNGGTELPLFILYDDGRAIYPAQRKRGNPVSYRVACLAERGDSLRARFGLNAAVRQLRERYDYRPNWSDQESVFLFWWYGDTLSRVTVRAGRTGVDQFSSDVPAAFREAYRRMVEFEAPNSVPWEPDSLEVAVWPYEYAPDNPPLEWPGDWPDLRSKTTRHEKDRFVDEIHLLYLDGDQRERLERFLAQRRERQAIRMNGRKWAVGYRMLFPGESRWKPLIQDLEV